jgi:hypothetical protein
MICVHPLGKPEYGSGIEAKGAADPACATGKPTHTFGESIRLTLNKPSSHVQ